MTTPGKRPYRRGGTTCTADGCDRKAKARDLCMSHYQRARRGAEVAGALRAPGVEQCQAGDCDRPVHGRGYCQAHYWQARNKGEITPIRDRTSPGSECTVDECDKTGVATGLCQTHYNRKRAGDPDWGRPIKPKAADGEGHLNKDGYRIIRCSRTGRLVGEHVIKTEALLGRELAWETTLTGRRRAVENVHHLNGNRSDNTTDGPFVLDDRGRLRSGNLEVWSTSQPAGQEIGPKIDWAVEMLRLYAPERLAE